MRKLKRTLSFVIAAAMILSLMPTFAFATVGDTYTYVFNPNADDETEFKNANFTWENTTSATVAGSTPWEYLGGYGLATGYPQTQNWGDNKDKNVYFKDTAIATYYYAGFKLQLPETGVYSARLDYTAYKTSGAVELYLLPGDTVLKYDGTDDFSAYSAYELTNNAVSLNPSLFDTTSTLMGKYHSLPNSATVSSASEVGKTGTGRILVIKSAQKPSAVSGTGERSNDYITNVTLTKTADVSGEGGEEEQPTMYTVTYASGDAAVTAPDAQEVESGTEIDLPSALSREGYTFNGWSDGKTTYAAGEKYTVNAAVTFTAQWTENIVVEPTSGPITLVFNNATLSNNTNIEATTYKGGTDYTAFSIDTANSDTGTARSTALGYRAYLAMGNATTNWLNSENTKGRLTFTTSAITEAGYYKVNYQGVNNKYPVITYIYVNGKYAGMYDAEAAATEATADARDLNTVYINPAENGGKVDIQLRIAANYGLNKTPYMMPAQITLTPIEDNDFSYAGATVECAVPKTLEGSTAITPIVKLANGEVFDFNNYAIDGTQDTTNTYLTVSIGNESYLAAEKAVNLTDNNAVLENKAALNKWTLTSIKSGDTTVIVSGKINGVAFSKAYPISVPKTDADYYQEAASFGYNTNLPSELKSNVSVAGVAIGQVNGNATKGVEYDLTATETVEAEDGTTYKFVGWKRGSSENDNWAAYVSMDAKTTYKLWSNTYLTAVYDEEGTASGQTIEFYNQDGSFCGSKSASEVASLDLTKGPSLIGHTFIKWQYINQNGETVEFTNDIDVSTLHEAVTRVVALQEARSVTVTYENGTYGEGTVAPTEASKTYSYGDKIDTTANYATDATKVYWYRDGQLTSTNINYNLYAWADTVLTPVFCDAIPAESVIPGIRYPKVVLDDQDNNGAYMIEWERYTSGTTIVEAGIIFSDSENIELRSFDGEKYTSQRNGNRGQFAAKPGKDYNYVRGYIIWKNDNTGVLTVVYTGDSVAVQ